VTYRQVSIFIINRSFKAEHKREHPLEALTTANALKAKLATFAWAKPSRRS
jgi:hypothetical protein